jgi:argininosuccinate synthase
MGTSLARPLIAKEQIKIAFEEGADAVAHGATGKGNDQVRFELTFSALAPHLKVIAPWREWDFKGRQDLIAYAQKHGIPIPVTPEKPYSIDANLFHISYEGGILEDLWTEPPEDMFLMTVSPEKAPDKPEYIEIEFERGEPIAVNGEKLSPANLLKRLNEIGGRHGVGRIDMVENRFVGLKSRGIYETPGGTILHIAHRALEQITLDREVMRLKDSLMPKIAEMIYYGFWFSPEFQALKTMVEQTQERVSGTIRVKLYKGNVIIAGRKSPNSLYKKRLVSFEEKEGYNPKDAEGFIRLQGLRLKIYNLSKEEEA